WRRRVSIQPRRRHGWSTGRLPARRTERYLRPCQRRHHDRPGAEEFYRQFKRQSHLSLQFARARPRKLLFEHYLQPDSSNQHQYRRRQHPLLRWQRRRQLGLLRAERTVRSQRVLSNHHTVVRHRRLYKNNVVAGRTAALLENVALVFFGVRRGRQFRLSGEERRRRGTRRRPRGRPQRFSDDDPVSLQEVAMVYGQFGAEL